MAPLPESNTTRWFLTYQTCNHQHTMTVRSDADVSEGTLSEEVGAFLEAMEPGLFNSTFIRLERSAEGSNVRLPAVWSGPTEWGGASGAEQDAPFFWSFTGKDVNGRRFRLELFGRNTPSNANWRLYAVDDSAIAAAVAALETTEPIFLTIGGAGPVYNQYANQSVAQHWVGELRQ